MLRISLRINNFFPAFIKYEELNRGFPRSDDCFLEIFIEAKFLNNYIFTGNI